MKNKLYVLSILFCMCPLFGIKGKTKRKGVPRKKIASSPKNLDTYLEVLSEHVKSGQMTKVIDVIKILDSNNDLKVKNTLDCQRILLLVKGFAKGLVQEEKTRYLADVLDKEQEEDASRLYGANGICALVSDFVKRKLHVLRLPRY